MKSFTLASVLLCSSAVCVSTAFAPKHHSHVRMRAATTPAFMTVPQTDAIVGNSTMVESSSSSSSSDLLKDAQFGQVVEMRRRPSSQEEPLQQPQDAAAIGSTSTSTTTRSSSVVDEFVKMQRRNIGVAVAAVVLAVANYMWQFTHPITAVQLLARLQETSEPVTVIGSNAKPTVVDFWAPWCEECKMAAPTLSKVEEEYKDRVNFVMVNGDRQDAWPYIEAFRVDAIPHLALVDARGDVKTALIGPIPKHVLEADLDALIRQGNSEGAKEELPFKMLDAFASRPEERRVHFDD